MASFKKLSRCRISGSKNLKKILSLGNQELTGVFPSSSKTKVTKGPLDLLWCPDSGLLQLGHSYNPEEMYGENYGYRSGLNQSMVDHLNRKVDWLEKRMGLTSGDTVLDIGSNDCTTLNAYKTGNIKRIGIDPTGEKFSSFYSDKIKLVPDFFTKEGYYSVAKEKAKIITSIAMFYDLEEPTSFVKDINKILHPEGIWHFEQSYMPSMLRLTSYDTICHEHLEYYSLTVVKNIIESLELKIVDVSMNSINGGSFAVTVAHKGNKKIYSNDAVINWLIQQEDNMKLNSLHPYQEFSERVYRHKNDLTRLIKTLNADGKKIFGYGASTKGNAVLQYCDLGPNEIPLIAEVNEEKFGRFTPGTHIPIISEKEARVIAPDYFLVLPWHFKDSILRREKEFLNAGGHFIFPFPEIEII